MSTRGRIYSLGVMAYEMLSGKRPFGAESPLEALTQRLTQNPPPLTSVAPGVDDDRADAILSLKSWQTAAWQSGSASMLLRQDATGQTPHAAREGAPTAAVASTVNRTNEVTRL